MSDAYQIDAKVREKSGGSNAIRRAGLIPCVVYGGKGEAQSLTVDAHNFRQAMKEPGFVRSVIELVVNGKKQQVLARELQLHPVTDAVQHIDFLRLTKGDTITVMVPVLFINEESSTGLKRGGVLNIVRHEIEMICDAMNIPAELTIDLAGADIGHAFHFSAIDLPEGAAPVIQDRDFTVATIAAPTTEQETAVAAAEGEGEEADADQADSDED